MERTISITMERTITEVSKNVIRYRCENDFLLNYQNNCVEILNML